MKILLTHCDYIEYEAKKKAIAEAEPVEKEKVRVDECLVVFCSAEQGDDEKVVEPTVKEIKDVAGQVDAKRIVVYPFVHISSTPAKPQIALKIVKGVEEKLREERFEVWRSPFGWYKAFSLHCKGHPLAELSREIRYGETREKPKKEEKSIVKIKVQKQEEQKDLAPNDHRVLGNLLDLYSFQEYAPGMTFFHPKGMVVRNQLIEFWRKEHVKRGYKEVFTPLIMNKVLWEISGHWDHYRENMFWTKIDDVDFGVKPMNCAGAILVFKNSTRSYRDLPMRLAELGQVHRNELSGVLSGLFRLRYFTQDDAHIFVTENQLEEYRIELSTRPENYMGSKEVWDKAEAALEGALKKKHMAYKINEGDGAFYGPKIDFHLTDSLGRTWQCATVQADFQIPVRFDVNYIGEDNLPHKPVIIHRVIYGAIERFLGILVEHYSGAFPLWLSPVQVRVLPLAERNNAKAEQVVHNLLAAGIRAEADLRSTTVDYRVREAEVQKIPYILVVGDKEEAAGTLAVRARGSSKPQFGVMMEDFLAQLREEIESKK